jgi:hypothetical protein
VCQYKIEICREDAKHVWPGKPSFLFLISAAGSRAVIKAGSDRNESIGDINYSFAALDPLHMRVSDPDPLVIPGMSPDNITLSETIKALVGRIYGHFTDFDKRLKSNREIRDTILRDEKINKNGTIHTCLIGSTSMDIETLGQLENEKGIIYGERVNRFRGLEDIQTIFTFEKDKDQTVITADLDIKHKSMIIKALMLLLKKMGIWQTRKGLQTLKRNDEQD